MRHSLVIAMMSAAALTGVAQAADLPVGVPAAPVLVVPPYDWSGPYIGGHIGGAWNRETATNPAATATFPAGTSLIADGQGFIGGAQAGVNFQAASWVIGFEGDASWTQNKASVTTVSILIPTVTTVVSSQIDWFATAAARIGYAFNTTLVYAKGGGAWEAINYTSAATGTVGGVAVAVTNTIKETRFGWTAGGGIEQGFTPNLSAKIEYNYLDFGTRNYSFISPPLNSSVDIRSRVHMVKAGLNWRMNWGSPVSPRY